MGWEKILYQYYCPKPAQVEDPCRDVVLEVADIKGIPMFLHLLSEQTLRCIERSPTLTEQILDLERKLSEERSMTGNAGNTHVTARKQ